MAKPRVRHVSEMPLEIVAADVQAGDIWLGESPTRIDAVEPGDTIDIIPWNEGRTGVPVPTQLIRITGEIIGGRDRGFKGSWTLQPDQPMEIERRG